MCSIYAALNTPTGLEERIHVALRELRQLFEADGICIYLLGEDGSYYSEFSYGVSETACRIQPVASQEQRRALCGALPTFRHIR